MKKVLIPTKLDKVAADILTANGNYEVIQNDALPPAELAAKHSDAYALIVRSEKVEAALIDLLPQLRVIVRAGAGYNTIDVKHARKRRVDVMNTPGANANAVAEEVLALILSDSRHVIEAHASAKAGKWEKKRFMGHELSGKTVGIVGLGNTGRTLAKRLSGFDVRILGNDPFISRDRAASLNVELVDIETLFAQSDYVSLHIPEDEATRGMIGAKALSVMKDGATLVNCARAGVLDEKALRDAKKRKKIRFLNDVYERDEEGAKSVADIADIMLPHLGASTHEANCKAARNAAEQLIEFDEKGVTSFIVNRDIPEGLDEAYCALANTLGRLCRNLAGADATPKAIETSFYGSLEPFGNWLFSPIVAGICRGFDPTLDYKAAERFLVERGIGYVNREADRGKGYGNSITVDLTAGIDAGSLRQVSVRGTVTENRLMVSRINDFDRLYFEPAGHTVFFEYEDRPGVVGRIGAGLGAFGINIEDLRHSHNIKTGRSLAIIKTNRLLAPEDVLKIAGEINANPAFAVDF